MKKIKLTVVGIAVLLIAAQNLTMFKIPSMFNLELGPAFWISFWFCNAAFLIVTLMLWFGLNEKKDATIHLGALLGVSYTYLAEEIAIANLFIYTPNAKTTPVWLCQLASMLIYLATILLVLLGVFWKEKNQKHVNKKVGFIYSLELELTKAGNYAENIDVQKAIESLREKIHFADPMSNENASEEEAKLVLLVSEIVQKSKDSQEVMPLIKEAENVLKVRNEICLRTK